MFESNNKWYDVIKGFAGARFEALIQSPDGIIAFMSDPSPPMRAAAILAGYGLWQIRTKEFIETCCTIARNDSDSETQYTAVIAIMGILLRLDVPLIRGTLAGIVSDPKARNGLRNDAFRALQHFEEGYSDKAEEDAKRDLEAAFARREPALCDIDWGLVRRHVNAGS